MSFAEATEPEFNPFEPRQDNDQALETLVRSIRFAEEFALFFAVCNQNSLRARINAELKARLEGIEVEEFPIREPVRNLYRELTARYGGERGEAPGVLLVYGIEGWLPAGDEGAHSDFVRNLNAARNNFPLLLKRPLVLWVPEHGLESIARGAPDFFSVRSGILTFSETQEEQQHMESVVRDIGLDAVAGLPFEDKQARIREIERLLREYQSLPEERRDEKAEERLLSAAADTYYAMANYKEAEPLLRRLVSIAEMRYGSESPEFARNINNLASLLQTTNRLDEAEPLMRRVMAIVELAYGPEHPKVAIALSNLAQWLKDTNRLGEAEPLLRRALDIDEKAFGHEHPKVAIRLNNLASLLKTTNRLGEVEPLMRRVISIFEKSFGESHPNVATGLNNLASMLKATNRLGEAEPLLRRALDINELAYGPEHPEVATILNNLALLLQATNRMDEAEQLLRRALAIFEKAYGPEHPHAVTVANNLKELQKLKSG